MRRLRSDAAPPVDFWPYFDAIPAPDFFGHRCEGTVTYVYRGDSERYEHVLVDTEDDNVYMVIVVDLNARRVLGHRLLDLNAEYGRAGAS